MRRGFVLICLGLFSLCTFADTENLITVSANGTRTTYAFSELKSATIEDKSAELVTLNVKFNDGSSVGNIRTLIHEIIPDEPQQELEIQVGDKSVTFTWPAVNNASTYTIVIYNDDEKTSKYCTLTFDSNGLLIDVDFNNIAPSKKSAPTILSYTLYGLESGKQYQYEMKAYDSKEKVLEEESGSFKTGDPILAVDPNPVSVNIYTRGKTIIVDCLSISDIIFFDTLGRQVGGNIKTEHCEFTVTLGGVYIVNIDGKSTKIKVD